MVSLLCLAIHGLLFMLGVKIESVLITSDRYHMTGFVISTGFVAVIYVIWETSAKNDWRPRA